MDCEREKLPFTQHGVSLDPTRKLHYRPMAALESGNERPYGGGPASACDS